MSKLLKAGLITATMLASINGAFAKDTLVVGEVLEPPGLDPTANAAAGIRQVTYANLYEGLVRIVEDGTVKPQLAESWTVSDDKKTYTFKLRQGVKFHDGTPFDCSVVKFSYERAVAPDSTNAQKGLFEPIASTECPDPATAVVTLKRPITRPSLLERVRSSSSAGCRVIVSSSTVTRTIGASQQSFLRLLSAL